LLIVTSPRGFPLGEHGHVGGQPQLPYGETVHVPWLIRAPSRQTALQRSFAFVQPPDMAATLLDWFQVGDSSAPLGWGRSLWPLLQGQSQPGRDRAATGEGGCCSLHTPAWFWNRQPDGQAQLYAKPDDRWEINQVADRCPEVAQQMETQFQQFQSAVDSGEHNLDPLPDSLVEPTAA
jgi:hypothetical protein